MSVLADGELPRKIRGVIKTYVYSAVGEKGKNTGPFSLRFSTIYFGVHLISIFFSNLHKINNLYLNMGISTDIWRMAVGIFHSHVRSSPLIEIL